MYFILYNISKPIVFAFKILDNVRRIQAELAGKNPFFWYTFQPIQSLHVTLFVIRLDVAKIQRCFFANYLFHFLIISVQKLHLKRLPKNITEVGKSSLLDLIISGVKHFLPLLSLRVLPMLQAFMVIKILC